MGKREIVLFISILLGCGGSQNRSSDTPPDAPRTSVGPSSDPCGPADDLEQGAQTAGASAEVGGRTAVEGVKTFGKAVGGWFEGGSGEAKEKWDEGKEKTRETARVGAAKVGTAASTRPCTPAAPH